jgi:periplasmic protein CpxP/Spy
MIRFTKAILAMAAATVLLSFMVSAQPARMTPQERTDKMAKDLSLTKEQQAKVLDILTKSQESMKKVRDESNGDREAMRPAMQKLRQESDDQLKKVLTKDQLDTFEKQRSEAQDRQRGNAAPDAAKAPKAPKAPSATEQSKTPAPSPAPETAPAKP